MHSTDQHFHSSPKDLLGSYSNNLSEKMSYHLQKLKLLGHTWRLKKHFFITAAALNFSYLPLKLLIFSDVMVSALEDFW